MKSSGVVRATCAIVMLVAMGGCTMMQEVRLEPSSHIAPPNSNVRPIGQVSAEVSSTSLLQPDLSSELLLKAYRAALAQKGGDILIDVRIKRSAKLIPLFLITIVTTTVRVDATAAKLIVGEQEISALQREEVERLSATLPLPEVETVKEVAR